LETATRFGFAVEGYCQRHDDITHLTLESRPLPQRRGGIPQKRKLSLTRNGTGGQPVYHYDPSSPNIGQMTLVRFGSLGARRGFPADPSTLRDRPDRCGEDGNIMGLGIRRLRIDSLGCGGRGEKENKKQINAKVTRQTFTRWLPSLLRIRRRCWLARCMARPSLLTSSSTAV